MTRVAITAVSIPATSADGYNLTDSTDFETMATGAGNGVEFTFNPRTVVILKNTTGGTATYTLKFPTFGNITAAGGSVTEPAMTIATGKSHVLRLGSIFKQTNGKVYIDCDVAADILVIQY